MFIVFEGLDGSGKTTQSKLLVNKLIDAGYWAEHYREPGDTELGEIIRSISKNPAISACEKSLVFMFMAARTQLHHEGINPDLDKGKVVVCDRWGWSTLAYNLKVEDWSLGFNCLAFAAEDNGPTITILLDIPVSTFRERNKRNEGDRIELRDDRYFQTVRENYLKLSQITTGWKVFDGCAEQSKLEKDIWAYVKQKIDSAEG